LLIIFLILIIKMKAAVIDKYNSISWKYKKDPVPKENEVLVQIAHASICGTDQHIFKGEFHPRTHLPLIPGHEFAGTVVKTGKNVHRLKKGTRVAVDPIIWCGICPACRLGHFPACSSLKLVGIDLDGGFAEYISVNESMCYQLKDEISLKHAALIELLAIGFHACKRAGLEAGDSALIYGAGKLGQCILQAAKTITKKQVFVVDILENRLQIAKNNYPDIITINGLKENPVDVVKDNTSGNGVDIAFEAVGHAMKIKNRMHPVRECIHAIRGAGKICVLGLADDPAPLVMKELILKEGRIIASRVTQGEFEQVIQKMQYLKPDALITSELRMDKAQEAFELLEKDPENQLKIILTA
jgi:2-desacetyl-2-hydroxyethyl bacteriochlorophyllide A dehydrogenase